CFRQRRGLRLVPVEDCSKVSGSVLAGASGVLQHVHERPLLGGLLTTPAPMVVSALRSWAVALPAPPRGVPVPVRYRGGRSRERGVPSSNGLAWAAAPIRGDRLPKLGGLRVLPGLVAAAGAVVLGPDGPDGFHGGPQVRRVGRAPGRKRGRSEEHRGGRW